MNTQGVLGYVVLVERAPIGHANIQELADLDARFVVAEEGGILLSARDEDLRDDSEDFG